MDFSKWADPLFWNEIAKRIESFGIDSIEVDGHNLKELEKAFNKKTKKTKAIIANTIKGKGVSFMENELKWHYKSPNDEELRIALADIEKS